MIVHGRMPLVSILIKAKTADASIDSFNGKTTAKRRVIKVTASKYNICENMVNTTYCRHAIIAQFVRVIVLTSLTIEYHNLILFTMRTVPDTIDSVIL